MKRRHGHVLAEEREIGKPLANSHAIHTKLSKFAAVLDERVQRVKEIELAASPTPKNIAGRT